MERGMIHGAVQMDMLRAGGLHMSGHLKLAKAVLKEAVAFAEKERYVAPFVECSTVLGPLLADAARDPLFRRDLPFLPAVLSACGLAAAQTTHESGVSTGHGPYYYTGRELEVLRLVAAGYKKREIAARLFISPHTVKTHARHIFDKLQAKTKAEAICRAREAGLIG
jgi:LuxR family maltose regulon positive regulatory protein